MVRRAYVVNFKESKGPGRLKNIEKREGYRSRRMPGSFRSTPLLLIILFLIDFIIHYCSLFKD